MPDTEIPRASSTEWPGRSGVMIRRIRDAANDTAEHALASRRNSPLPTLGEPVTRCYRPEAIERAKMALHIANMDFL